MQSYVNVDDLHNCVENYYVLTQANVQQYIFYSKDKEDWVTRQLPGRDALANNNNKLLQIKSNQVQLFIVWEELQQKSKNSRQFFI